MDINYKYGAVMKYIGVLLILLLMGCVSTPPFQKAKINGKYEILGAKIYSPNELGWYVIQHSQNSITFGTIPKNLVRNITYLVKEINQATDIYNW